jgi:hypothetical protein
MEPTQELEEAKRTLIPEESTWPPNLPENIRVELRLRRALQVKIIELAQQMERGELEITWEQLHTHLNEIAKETTGMEYGIPLPSMHDIKRPLITASRVPLSHVVARTELEEEIQAESPRALIRNSWRMLGDKEVCVIQTEEGPMYFPRYFAGLRLRKLLDSAFLRSGMSIDADCEIRAMESLKKRINGRQWDSYVLSGIFPELSERSDIHYFFRKGFPTLAVSYHGYPEGRVLAALCLHPVGYYQGSHCGLMTPTDEVISHLLMMRGDERKYWASCGQWSAWDTRSGI